MKSERQSQDLRSLIYEWNQQEKTYRLPKNTVKRPKILDETLRDGLQSTTVKDPSIEEKIELLHIMCDLGIDAVNIGFAAAAPRIYEDALALAKVIRDEKLPITPYCLGRTVVDDVQKIVEISRTLDFEVQAFLFVGASPIRHFVENWSLETLLERTEQAVRHARKNHLTTMFFTEDTTRSHPNVLKALWKKAIAAGANRLGIADTVGYVNPQGVSQIVQFCRSVIQSTGKKIGIDFHGHNDRGLSVANSLAAVRAGADRVHGCALAIGERVGNTSMEQLLVNLKLEGYPNFTDRNLSRLRDYVNLVSNACKIPIPSDYPIVGENAFRTSTGIHAAAVIKAHKMGGYWLADRVYSAVPAEEIGLGQVIEVGPQSGKSNVQHWLTKQGYHEEAASDEVITRILESVKEEDRILLEHELHELVNAFKAKIFA